MKCIRPLNAWRSFSQPTEAGRGSVVFSRPAGPAEAIVLPCGQCVGCRLAKAQEWSVRCMHEASLYEDNCFVTLTYADESLPELGTLVKRDHQLFVKDLRRAFPRRRIRYFMCGEYGDDFARPHYHFLLFNVRFPDEYYWCMSKGNKFYRSPLLESLWTHGNSWIGDLTVESAEYVARYTLKKVNGDKAFERYVRDLDPETGELLMVEPDYVAMSRRPGIGSAWWKQFKRDCDKDFLTIEGKRFTVPGYYDRLLEMEDTDRYLQVKAKRKEVAQSEPLNRKRLLGIEAHLRESAKRRKRSL